MWRMYIENIESPLFFLTMIPEWTYNRNNKKTWRHSQLRTLGLQWLVILMKFRRVSLTHGQGLQVSNLVDFPLLKKIFLHSINICACHKVFSCSVLFLRHHRSSLSLWPRREGKCSLHPSPWPEGKCVLTLLPWPEEMLLASPLAMSRTRTLPSFKARVGRKCLSVLHPQPKGSSFSFYGHG